MSWQRGIGILTGVYVCRLLGMFMLFPVFSVYARGLEHADPLTIGIALGIYGLTQGLLQIPFGKLSDKFGRKPIIIIGLTIFIVGSLLAMTAQDIQTMIIARCIQGMGAVSAVVMAFATDLTPSDKLNKAMAIIGGSIGLAFVLSLMIAPSLSAWIGVDGIFALIAILSLFSAFSAKLLPNLEKKALPKTDFIFDRQKLILGCGSVFTLHFLFTGIFVVLPILFHEMGYHSDLWQIYLPANIIALFFMRRKHAPQALSFGLDYLFLAIGLLLLISASPFIWLLMASSIFFIGFYRLETGLPHYVASIAEIENRGTIMGYFTSSQFIGSFIGGTTAGLLWKTFNPHFTIGVLGVLAGISGLVLLNIGKKKGI